MAKLTLDRGGARESFPLGEEAITIGRSPGNTIIIDDTASSRRHCRIDPVEAGFELLDLESQNGTRVNGKAVKRHMLVPGDRIEIGTHAFTFTAEDAVDVEEVEIEGETDSAAIFLVFEGGPNDAERVDLPAGTHVVGRKKAPGVAIAIDDASVSSKHAEIRVGDGEEPAKIKDLGSTNGTFKNGARISEAELRHGDQIRFGSVKLRFSDSRTGADLPEVTVLRGDEAEGGKRSMLPSVALLVLLLAAGGTAAYFTFRPDHNEVQPAGDAPAGSLIREGWSFEEAESANVWKAEEGTASPAEGAAKSGAFALRLTTGGADEASGLGVASYDRDLSVRGGVTYRVSAAVSTSGGSGIGGLLVRYYDRNGAHPDEPLWRTGTEFVPLGSGFRPLQAIVSAPSSMIVSHARVSCVACGSGVRALFDDVVFAPAEADAGRGTPSLALESFTLDVGRGGSLTLRRGNIAWLEDLQCVGAKSELGTFEAALLARSPATSTIEGGAKFEATLCAPGADESNAKLVVEATTGANEPTYHVRVEGPEAGAAGLDSLAIEAVLGEPLALQPVVLVTESAARPLSGEAAPSDATGVVLGAGDDRLRIKGAAPLRVGVATSGGRTRLRFEPPPGSPLRLEFDIQVSFTAERGQAKTLSIDAEQAEREGRFGDAIARYRSILKDFPFNEKVTEVAAARVKELEARVDKEVARLGATLVEAQFFGMAPLLEKVKGEAETAARAYSGTKGAADATEMAGKAATALEVISRANVEARAELELAKGRDLLTSGSKSLASVVLRDVVARYSGTKAAEQAKAALEQDQH